MKTQHLYIFLDKSAALWTSCDVPKDVMVVRERVVTHHDCRGCQRRACMHTRNGAFKGSGMNFSAHCILIGRGWWGQYKY
jgi:hypothetical protein